jgi:endonuclease YncB( thermonuclease family)
MRVLKRLDPAFAALILIALIATGVYLSRSEETVAGVAAVIDGDSIRVAGLEVRLAGVDAPELRQTCRAEGRDYPCGEAARRALDALVGGHVVTCRLDGRDRYGRRLGACERAGADVGAALVRSGHAVAYGRYGPEEELARKGKRGLWGGSFEPPAAWRQTHADETL